MHVLLNRVYHCRMSPRSHVASLMYYSLCRFTFTQLDAGDPTRAFSFFLKVNEEDTYVVEETSPPLHQTDDLTELLENLNAKEDLNAFVRGMRNVFSATL